MSERPIKTVTETSAAPPPSDRWADHAPRELTPETHILQTMVVKPEMPLSEFLQQFSFDEDLGLRFVRTSASGHRAEVEILWRRDDEIEIAIGVRRESGAASHPTGNDRPT